MKDTLGCPFRFSACSLQRVLNLSHVLSFKFWIIYLNAMVRFCFNTTFVSEEVWIVIHTGVSHSCLNRPIVWGIFVKKLVFSKILGLQETVRLAFHKNAHLLQDTARFDGVFNWYSLIYEPYTAHENGVQDLVMLLQPKSETLRLRQIITNFCGYCKHFLHRPTYI